jgi:hypothetical protein
MPHAQLLQNEVTNNAQTLDRGSALLHIAADIRSNKPELANIGSQLGYRAATCRRSRGTGTTRDRMATATTCSATGSSKRRSDCRFTAKQSAYEDQQRDMDLQERKLKLQAEQVRVNRENDVIDAQLKRENAQTDVVQSNADANRNISEGGKSLLEDTGKAKVKEASSWFSK